MLVAIDVDMSLRSALLQNVEAAVIVVISTGLAIFGAHHFERSGPDRQLLRQLREMQEVPREQGAEGEFPRPIYHYASPPVVVERHARR